MRLPEGFLWPERIDVHNPTMGFQASAHPQEKEQVKKSAMSPKVVQQTSTDRPELQGIQQRNTGAIPKTFPKQQVNDRVKTTVGNRILSAHPVKPSGKPPICPTMIPNPLAQPSYSRYLDLVAKLGSISAIMNVSCSARPIWTEPINPGHPNPTVPLSTPLTRNEIENVTLVNACQNDQQNTLPAFPAPKVPEYGSSPRS